MKTKPRKSVRFVNWSSYCTIELNVFIFLAVNEFLVIGN